MALNNFKVHFSEPFPSYMESSGSCCRGRNAMTLTMWLSITRFPATLFSLREAATSDPTIVLRILSDGNITLFFKGNNARLVRCTINLTFSKKLTRAAFDIQILYGFRVWMAGPDPNTRENCNR